MVAFAIREARMGYAAQRGLPSEAVLAQLWAGQRFPAGALVTREGARLRVLHPGQGGRGAGPDFRHARIATPDGLILLGDVELHVRSSDFRAHGHHLDPRYDRVVLHLVFEDDAAGETRLAGGGRPAVAALAPWARRRAQEIASWLSAPTRWSEPCRDAAARLGREEVLATLDALGDQRFREREAALAGEVAEHGPAEPLYRRLLAAAGFGGDRDLPHLVAERLPWRRLAPYLGDGAMLEALLLGTAGLLASQQAHEVADPHETALEERWRGVGGAPAAPAQRMTTSRRPANHPARRLAGLARLLNVHRALLDGTGAADLGVASPAEAIAVWTVPARGYWRTHLAPGVPTGSSPGALIGRARAIELLSNAVLPWVAGTGRGEAPARARSLFAELPLPGRYGRLAFLERNLAPDGERLPLDARRQQGLLALYRTECTQGGCGRCPLS